MPPLSIMIKPVSGLCNMACSYCFYKDEMQNRETALYGLMEDATIEKIIRRAFAYAEQEVLFAFQGGEPTLAGADFYKRVLTLQKYYNGKNIKVSNALQTNGYQLDDTLLEVLKQGDFLIGVSLDGTRAIHDQRRFDRTGKPTYDRILSNIERLQKAEIDFNILCVVDNEIAMHAQEVFDELKKYQYLQFIPCMDPIGSTDSIALSPEAYGEFLSVMFRNYDASLRKGKSISIRTFDNWMLMINNRPPESCGALGCCSANYLIESNGNVYPCDFYALDEWLLGNINRKSFTFLSHTEKRMAFLNESLPMSEDCKKCKYVGLCHGGCKHESMLFRETGVRKDRMCEGYMAFFEKHWDELIALGRFIGSKWKL